MKSSSTVSFFFNETGASAPIPPSPRLRTLIQNWLGLAFRRPLSRTLSATLYLGYACTSFKDSSYMQGNSAVVARGQIPSKEIRAQALCASGRGDNCASSESPKGGSRGPIVLNLIKASTVARFAERRLLKPPLQGLLVDRIRSPQEGANER